MRLRSWVRRGGDDDGRRPDRLGRAVVTSGRESAAASRSDSGACVRCAGSVRSSSVTSETRTLVVPSRRSSLPWARTSGAARTCGAVAVVDRRRHDQVDGAALVFEQHEDDPLGGLGALAGDDHPRHLDLAAVLDPLQVGAAQQLRVEAGAHQRHRVLAQRHPDRAVVGDRLPPAAQRLQRRRAAASPAAAPSASPPPCRTPVPATADLPERLPPSARRRAVDVPIWVLDRHSLASSSRAPAQARRSRPSRPAPEREARSAIPR